jgi:CubicO group peptidase (beta-lactamase class C family)
VLDLLAGVSLFDVSPENPSMPRSLAAFPRALVFIWLVVVAPSTRAGQEAPHQDLPSSKAKAPREVLHGLDGYIEAGMKRWQIPGLAIGIVKDDHLVFAKGFGLREVGKPEKVTEKTFFAMASQSKAFTATALGLLIQDQKLQWDDRATKHLPWFQMYDPYVTRELTVRDLLCHRCGLGTWQGDLMWYGSELSRKEVLERVRFLEPEFSFRSRFGYCNLAFVAAGEIIPAVTGLTWGEFLKRRLFEPMGMSRTNTDIGEMERLDDVARPHTMIKGKIVPIAYRATRNTAPAGAINSCVKDWAQWIRLQLNRGTLDGQKIVPAEVINETRTPQTLTSGRTEGDTFSFSAYGLGWALREYEGRLLIAHAGGLDGMLSLSVLVPEQKLGVVVVTNYDEQEFYRVLPMHVVDAYLNVSHDDLEETLLKARNEAEQKAREDEKDKPKPENRPSLDPSGYAGIYHDPVLGRATITAKDGKLTIEIERNPGLRGELTHWQYDTFRVEWADPFLRSSRIPFRLNERGQADEFRIRVRPDFVDPMEYRFSRNP